MNKNKNILKIILIKCIRGKTHNMDFFPEKDHQNSDTK